MTNFQQTIVLLVEDDDQTRDMYRSALNMAGFSVFVAADGLTALQYIERRSPDLIVLDLGLPLVSGESVLDELASSEVTRHIPVVVVTGMELERRKDVAAALKKPVEPYDLIAIVRQVLRRR